MNVKTQTLRFLGLGSLLAIALAVTPSTVRAGAVLPPDWHRATPIVTASDANAVKPDGTVVMVCSACKTVSVLERRLLPGAKAGAAVFTLGSKHECAMCGGEITTVNGKTVDSMQHNCRMCGADAAYCCVAPEATKKS
jgi:hypothetical protein